MSMVEIHKSALEELIVPYHHFLLQHKRSLKQLFGFVEGKDDPSYYQTLIEPMIPDSSWNVCLIESGDKNGNRDKVIKLLNLIDWNHYSRKQTIFFIDRDLSDFFPEPNINHDNLYITDCYSIENNIVTLHSLKRIIREFYNINLQDSEFSIIKNLFNDGLEIMSNVIKEICCNYIALRRLGAKPCFNDIKLNDLCQVKNCKVSIVSNEEVKKHLTDKWQFEPIDLRQIYDEFDTYNVNYRCLRGKYLMWYFVNFINSFCRCADELIPSINSPIKVTRVLTEKEAIIDLSARSRIPESLKLFITNTYLNYISEESMK
ncbi:MAG: DUF4435 domain-containing protein [Bacilli bacterium]|uniref:DUF4435 domain-containing protein n=1 Tax=Anaerorhabdus sp. TaxID=1872524 RepID=UPI002FC68076